MEHGLNLNTKIMQYKRNQLINIVRIFPINNMTFELQLFPYHGVKIGKISSHLVFRFVIFGNFLSFLGGALLSVRSYMFTAGQQMLKRYCCFCHLLHSCKVQCSDAQSLSQRSALTFAGHLGSRVLSARWALLDYCHC